MKVPLLPSNALHPTSLQPLLAEQKQFRFAIRAVPCIKRTSRRIESICNNQETVPVVEERALAGSILSNGNAEFES